MIIYPTSIRKPVVNRIEELNKSNWFDKPRRLPDTELFQLLVDTAFHASLMTEEKRRPGFRLLYCSPKDLEQNALPDVLRNRRFRTISIPSPRPFTVSELNRIAPAADLTRFLVCVYPQNKNSDSVHIWGLLDVGDNWWKFVHHEASSGMPPPNFLTITCTAPGELSFSIGGTILLMLKNGALSHPLNNPIWAGPISKYLDPSRQCLYDKTIQALKTEKWDNDDDDFPRRFYNFFLERILYNVRYLGHGGTIILVPDEIGSDDPRLTDRIVLKYATNYDYAWESLVRSLVNHRCYYDLYFSLSRGELEPTIAALLECSNLKDEGDSIDEEIQDIAKSIASLATVDGALVITTQFKVLGFGGEIVATSPTLRSVTEVSEGKQSVPIESFGTRHRSAFRFCSSFENSVAFIVSSDGGVKAATRHGRDVLFWPDINEGTMGL